MMIAKRFFPPEMIWLISSGSIMRYAGWTPAGSGTESAGRTGNKPEALAVLPRRLRLPVGMGVRSCSDSPPDDSCTGHQILAARAGVRALSAKQMSRVH